MSRCDICHPPTVDMESSALLLKSDLCLDCHDDIEAVSPEERRQGNISAMNNHPVKFSPRDFASVKINQNIIRVGWKFFISGPAGALPLFGETMGSAVVECATCHDPHGDTGHPKLRRIWGGNGELCLVCHLGY
ncbi:MAG: hypothetical protein JSW20_14495 [Nitrospiraceae bacterium]|nr:MAG: hypothetical protein JSW20_14495 [Nitrospiraceae bacterium]